MSTASRVTSHLEIHNGRPVFVYDGKVISQAIASDPVVDIPPLKHSKWELWLDRVRQFAGSGIHNYSICPVHWHNGIFADGRYWTGDGEYPIPDPNDGRYCLEQQGAAILEIDPEARFWVRFGDQVPDAWYKANPGHAQQNYTGERRPFTSPQISPASEKGLGDVCAAIRHLLGWVESLPWANRIFLYTFGMSGEGLTCTNVGGMIFDTSPAMQEAFRAYVRGKYADETALRAAWDDPAIAFDTVRVPHDPELVTARATVEHFIEGDQLRRFRDYFDLQRDLFLRWYKSVIRTVHASTRQRPVPFGIDMCKQHQLGWQHNLFFAGIGPGAEFLDMFRASGSIDVGELLDEPGLDLLWTPADYTARAVGYGWEAEGMHDSMLIRGKACIVENDSRTYCPTGNEHNCVGAFETIEEVRAGLLRNAAWCLARAGFDEWGSGGGAYFDDAAVQAEGLAPCTKLLDLAPHLPHVETEHAIAMIVDDSSPLYEDSTSGYQNIACIWQRVNGLAHCGIPYRIYLLSDLEKAAMPDYRCYYFPNLFMVDDARLDLLRRKIFRDGRMSIFGPATGITDGETLSATGAGRVLGVEMELFRGHSQHHVILQGPHPIAQALPASLTYGDPLPYGPQLAPAKGVLDPRTEKVGMGTVNWAFNRPGLFVKDHGTHKIAWTAALPMPANLLRELARWGGCHVWCEEDDVIQASDSIVSLHSVKSGPRTIKFATPRPVTDLLTGKKLGDALSEITVEVTSPETVIYYTRE
jgi:hypothetical protein